MELLMDIITGLCTLRHYVSLWHLAHKQKSFLCGGLYEALRENEYLMEFRSERITRPPFILLTINVHAFTKSIRRFPCNFLLSSVIIISLLMLAFNKLENIATSSDIIRGDGNFSNLFIISFSR